MLKFGNASLHSGPRLGQLEKLAQGRRRLPLELLLPAWAASRTLAAREPPAPALDARAESVCGIE